MSSPPTSSQPQQSAQIPEPIEALHSDDLEDADVLSLMSSHGNLTHVVHYQNESSSMPGTLDVPLDNQLMAAAEAEDEDEEMGDLISEDDEEPNARPNKYYGRPVEYRYYIKSERILHDSIMRLRAQDLSAHLHNSHNLKRRAYAQDSSAAERTKIIPGEKTWKRTTEKAFVPPNVWTAWPMPPDEVPRDGEWVGLRDDDEDWTYQRDDDVRPSATLEECLIGRVVREAKERFEKRELEGDLPPGFEEEEVATEGVREEPMSENEVGRKRRSKEQEKIFRPVVLADEDEASRLAKAPVRQTLSQLDDLLQNLHHQRVKYAIGDSSSATSDADSENKPSKQTQRRYHLNLPADKPVETAKRGNEMAQTANSASSPPESKPRPKRAASTYAFGSTTPVNNKQHKQRRPRDWSDLLALAALSNFSPSVLARTADRCSKLFGEDMLFRELNEDTASVDFRASSPYQSATRSSRIGPAKQIIPESSRLHGVPSTFVYPDPSSDDLYCPVIPCHPYNTSGLADGSREAFSSWKHRAEHIKVVHPWYKTLEEMDGEKLFGGVHVNGFLEEVRPRGKWDMRGGARQGAKGGPGAPRGPRKRKMELEARGER